MCMKERSRQTRSSRRTVIALIAIELVLIAIAAYLFWPQARYVSDTSPQEAYERGIRDLSRGQYAQAAEAFDQAATLDPANAQYLSELAVSRYRLHDTEAALRHYERLATFPSHTGFAYNGIANVYRDVGDTERALTYYEKALETDPQFVAAYSNAAILLSDIGRHTEAKAYLERGILANSTADTLRNTAQQLGINLGG